MCLPLGRDAGAADAGEPDAAPPTCECMPDAFADLCGASIVVLSQVSQPGGELVCGSTMMNGFDMAGCTGFPKPGRDAVFRFAAAAGQTVSVELVPLDFDGAIYVTSTCGSIACSAMADQIGSGVSEELSFIAATSDDYFVVVDSGVNAGCYELTVTVN